MMSTPPPSSLGALVQSRCAAYAARSLLIDRGSSWRYDEILLKASQLAARLRRHCAAGSYLSLWFPQDARFVVALFACILADCIPIVLDPRSRPRELERWQRHCGAEHMLSCQELAGQLRPKSTDVPPVLLNDLGQLAGRPPPPPPPRRAGNDIAVILPTSGSTSQPKAVALSHFNLLSNQRAWRARYPLTGDDVVLSTLALCHSFGLTAWLLATIDVGACAVLAQDAMPATVAQLAQERRATSFLAASSYYQYLLRSTSCNHEHLASVRLFASGACRLPSEVARRFAEKFGRPIHQTYGLTEAAPVVSANPLHDNRIGTVGTALDGVEIDLAELDGDIGELRVRGDNVMQGYLHHSEATAACLDSTGWLRTGDLARIDADGYITLVGRKKELIVRGGNKIYPDEVEQVLALHPAVREAAIVGLADRHYEEVPVAFLVAEGSARPSSLALTAFCRQHLADYKLPRQVHWLAELPRGSNGKVRKRLLCQLARAGPGC